VRILLRALGTKAGSFLLARRRWWARLARRCLRTWGATAPEWMASRISSGSLSAFTSFHELYRKRSRLKNIFESSSSFRFTLTGRIRRAELTSSEGDLRAA
jgi:hypothetical protein